MLIACKNTDHPLSVARSFVALNLLHMKKQSLNPFDLNRTEYAELLNISPNAVRMRMRHGKLEGQYEFRNGQYFFRAPEAVRENIGLNHGQKTTLKKIYRRGNHYKANYPNEAFRKHNEAKMLAKLKHNVDQEVQELLPEAVEIAKQKKRERLQSAMNQKPLLKNYSSGIINESYKGYGTHEYFSPRADLFSASKFRTRKYTPPKIKKGPYEI